eukprot:7343729-Prymnesium_polylepis.1
MRAAAPPSCRRLSTGCTSVSARRGQHDATRRAAYKIARGNAPTRRHTRAAGGAAAAARAHRVGARAGEGDTDAQNLSTGRH